MIFIWIRFVLCAAIIFIAGSKLARYGDIIATRTGLGGLWIGLVLLAIITSLPELFTGISAVTLVAAPLFACFFVGVAIKEAEVTRLVEFLSGPLLYGSTFFLGFVLGALLSAEIILDTKVLLLVGLGMLALLLSGIGGLIGGLIYYKLSHKKVNPLIGIAGVSCVPTTAKVAQKCAFEANKWAMILPYAMGPNVAGVITTAIITGIYVSGISFFD